MLPIPAAVLVSGIAIVGTWWHSEGELAGHEALSDARRVVLGLVALVLLMSSLVSWLLRSNEARGRALESSKEELGQRVRDRTRQLVHANICLQREVGDRRRIEGEIEATRRAATSADRARNDFIAEVGQEIRERLRSILGPASKSAAAATGPDARPCEGDVDRGGAETLVHLLDEFLDLSLIESGRLAFDRSKTAPVDLTTHVVELHSARALELEIDLRLEFRGELPVAIRTSPGRVVQVLAGLVRGALDETPAGRVVVSCTECASEAESAPGTVHSRSRSSPVPAIRWTITSTSAGPREDSLGALLAMAPRGKEQVGPDKANAVPRRLLRTLHGSIARHLGGSLSEQELGSGDRRWTFTIDPGPLDGVPRVRPRTTRSKRPADLDPGLDRNTAEAEDDARFDEELTDKPLSER